MENVLGKFGRRTFFCKMFCPNLAAANIGYKLLQRLGGAEATGPILEGMAKPVQVLQRGDGVSDVVRMAAICAVDAQGHQRARLS